MKYKLRIRLQLRESHNVKILLAINVDKKNSIVEFSYRYCLIII